MRSNPVKHLLKEGKPVVGTWMGFANVPAARFLARSGFAYLTVDIEHNAMGMETATNMFGSIADAGCVALARVPAGKHDHIKRVLDNGAHGVVVPMVNTRAEAEEAVNACLYPPRGNRSVGGSVHALNFDTDPATYFAKANDEIAIILQCEHIQAVRDFDQIFSVPGIDAVFVGPNDLAASMRGPDGSRPPRILSRRRSRRSSPAAGAIRSRQGFTPSASKKRRCASPTAGSSSPSTAKFAS